MVPRRGHERSWLGTLTAGAVAALAALAAHPVAADLPPSLPVNLTIDVDIGGEVLIPLRTLTPLPEPAEKGGQLNWPIFISPKTFGNEGVFDDYVVDTVKVKLRGLYHEEAGDLDVRLLHAGRSSMLSGNRGGTRTFGRPEPRDYGTLLTPVQRRRKFGIDVVQGEGFDYDFADLVGLNLADGRPGEQSSSISGDFTAAWRATDGNLISSGMATVTEANPWYQVDLGSSQDIGTVVLWTPDPENLVNEVQVVKTTGLVTLAGTFRLKLNHNGFTEVTEPISHNAVGPAQYEDKTSFEAGVGQGESMQAKIEKLDNVGLVSVTRSVPDREGGYEWTITFLTEYTDLNELAVHSNDLTAGKLRLPEDQVAGITITTKVDGTRNTFYNANMRFGAVLVSDTPFGSGNLAAARAVASAERSFEINAAQRQINVPMPTNTRGRYVRVTLLQTSYLSLAEIFVFTEELYSVQVFNGGSPIPPGTYVPEVAFSDIFGGTEIHGDWVLAITDSTNQQIEDEKTSHRRQLRHGSGAISDWILQVFPRHRDTGVVSNTPLTYHVGLSATILTLPKYGKLYEAASYTRGDLIEAQVGLEIFAGKCIGVDCSHKFGLGNILTTEKKGSRAVANQISHGRSVIYVPNANYRGTDSFTFRINRGTLPGSQVGTVTLRVKKCRIDCSNDRLFGMEPSIDESLTTPWDNRPFILPPPDRILQPDIYGARLWNDPYCPFPPCNEFSLPVN